MYYLKGDRALGNSILRNVSSECQNQDQHSFIAVQTQTGTLPNGVIEKQSVEAVCENGRQVPSLKMLTLDLFIIIFSITFCTLALYFDYLNIFTCTSAVIGYPLRRYQEPLADIY